MTLAAKKRKIFDNRYEIVSIVGRGAASVVYHAKHLSGSQADVALKVLLSQKGDKSNSELLRKEALAMVSARHKYVVRLDDFHSVGELAYLSMEFAVESDLRKYMKKTSNRLGPVQGQLFLIQMAEALNFVHQAGMIHRDIKPDNILVVSDYEARLADFGVTVLPGENSSLDDLQKGVGTMSYMAPEVLEGIGYDQRSDIYALGVTFYEIISGIHPFDNVPLLKQLEIRKPGGFPSIGTLVPGIPEHLSSAIMKCLSFDPAQRFATGRELVQALLLQPEPAVQDKAAAKQTPPATKPTQPDQASAKSEAKTPAQIVTSPQPKIGNAAQTKHAKGIHAVEKRDMPSEIKVENVVPVAPSAEPSQTASTEQPAPLEKSAEKSAEKQAAKAAPAQAAKIKKPIQLNRTPLEKPRLMNTPQAERFGIDDKQKRLYMTIAIAVFFLILALVVRPELAKYALRGIKKTITLNQNEPTPGLMPQYDGSALVFPELPYGMYQGELYGFAGRKKTAITIISLSAPNRLVFMLGLEGWRPVSVDPFGDSSSDEGVLRLKSSGFILDLTGQSSNGELKGNFRDVVSGDSGEWNLSPVTVQSAG